MNNYSVPNFLIIDDDPLSNQICSRYLELVLPGVSVRSFTSPQQGLDYMLSAYSAPHINYTILLLDINMPVLTGWEVLEKFKNFTDHIKQQFRIYILSSSVCIGDKEKAGNDPVISGFLEKPLNVTQLKDAFPKYARQDVADL